MSIWHYLCHVGLKRGTMTRGPMAAKVINARYFHYHDHDHEHSLVFPVQSTTHYWFLISVVAAALREWGKERGQEEARHSLCCRWDVNRASVDTVRLRFVVDGGVVTPAMLTGLDSTICETIGLLANSPLHFVQGRCCATWALGEFEALLV